MSAARRTKKMVITAALATAVGLAGLQTATASPDAAGPGMQHPCPMQQGAKMGKGMGMNKKLDPEMVKARNAFLGETREIRKALAEKRAAMRALMRGDNPDQAQASKLAGEMFDLREQMRTKAAEAGLPPHMMMGPMGMNRMPGDGPMKGGSHHGKKAMM
jgi:zinc resistance-associated protein